MNPVASNASTSQASTAPEKKVNPSPSRSDTIAQAQNGIEALEHYRAGKVDVMFLDLTMPDMDGYQVLETLRSEDLNCLVIVVSADVQEQAKARVKSLGAIAFIQKPVTADGLSDVLRTYGVIV